MPPLNTQTAGVISPILSNHARGYRNAQFIGRELFPRVSIPNRNMRVIRFGKEAFRMLNARRAPGAAVKRIQYGYVSDPVSLVQDALEATVPVEHQQEAESIPGIDLAAVNINVVLDVLDLGLEYEIAQLARNPALYGADHQLLLAGGARWTDPASDPAAHVHAAREVIRASTGRYPNLLTLGPTAANALKRHPAVKEQFKYTSASSITTDMLAAYFEIGRVIVGPAVYLPETAADTAQATDVWGDDAILAYVPAAGDNYQVPSFGYTYELAGYPQVEQPYPERQTKSWIYPTTVERRPYLVGAEAGFLFRNAGAAA